MFSSLPNKKLLNNMASANFYIMNVFTVVFESVKNASASEAF